MEPGPRPARSHTLTVDRCRGCGFEYGEHRVDQVVGELASLGPPLAARLTTEADDARRDALLRRRPEQDVWSALEYGCHVRDTFLSQRERLYLTLVEDEPSFAPMYRDRRVTLARYGADDPNRVARQVEMAADLLARAFSLLDEGDWSRTCIYNYPTPARRDVLWLAQHTLHEGVHHLADIDRVLGAPSP